MKTIKLFTNKDKQLIELLKESGEYEIVQLQKQSFLSKVLMQKKEYPDLYFHNGKFDEESIDMIKNAKKVIVNSFDQRYKIFSKNYRAKEDIEVVYPYVEPNELKPKESKQNIIQKYQFEEDTTIILFVSNNFKMGGIKEFVHILSHLNDKRFSALIVGNDKDVDRLQFAINQNPLKDQIKLLRKKDIDINEIYSASDIYIAPTYIENFSTNVLKAMINKTAVFVSATNAAREIVDVFATMSEPNDPSTIFKVDALVAGHEIKKIKKENKKIAKKFSKENKLQELHNIIDKIST
jgi:glycosyltransferase involved in cell wall biosynthesis